MASYLIADSGSTKTDWCLLKKGKKPVHFSTQGINPYMHSKDAIVGMLKNELPWDNSKHKVDVLHYFGAGAANPEKQQFLHEILKSHFAGYRDEMIISSKAGHQMWDGPYGDGGSRKYLMASLNQSLHRMKLDYVDIFYSHRYDENTPLEETMGALSDMVKQGKALYVGISKYPTDKAREAYRILRKNGTPCLINQDRYNIFTRDIEQSVLPLAEENGVGMIAFSPLAQGMLSDKYLNGIPENSRAAHSYGFLQKSQLTPERIEQIRKLNEIAAQRGQTLAQMALTWCLHQPGVNSVIIGTSSVKQLQDNIDALKNSAFTDDELWRIGELGA